MDVRKIWEQGGFHLTFRGPEGPETYCLDRVSSSYAGETVLRDFSLSLPSQGCLVVMGPSGLGKTSLLKILAGLHRPDAGQCHGLAGTRAAVLFQENRLLPWFSLYRNIRLVCRTEEETELWLRRVSLWEDRDKFPGELSGGMQRRAALARALAFGGDFYLMDEPFAGLDADLRQEMIALVRETCRESLLVVVTHDEAEREALLKE